MRSENNSKIIELQRVINDIKIQEKVLENMEFDRNDDKLPNEKKRVEKTIKELKVKEEQLNEELVENGEMTENIKIKYAIMLLKSFGNFEPEYSL